MFRKWLPIYFEIVKGMDYSIISDQASAFLLSFLLSFKSLSLEKIKSIVIKQPVITFGAGPSLSHDLNLLSIRSCLQRFVTIAADGATSAFLEKNIIPDIIVTDLDGNVKDILTASKQGAFIVIHAHGDNTAQLVKFVPQFEKALGTTQIIPIPPLHNFGGFTDGDRCVFLANALKAKSITLAGMDFGGRIGKYSKKQFDPIEKRIKLQIAKNILEWYSSHASIPLYNITSRGKHIAGFKEVNADTLIDLIKR